MQIVIVDDDRIQRLILRNQLVRLGYEVSEAIDGSAAWEQLQQQPVPIVITDWMMPKLNGPELIARIRAADFPSYTYVILLTSKDARTDMIAGLDAGADDYLIKPCNSDELRARVAIGARIVDLESRLRTARDTDALTGLRNRGAITAAVETELARTQRSGEPLSLVLLDIDYFKQVNDDYGHQVGDQALRLIAAVVRQHVRPYDIVGRWGGEEFLLLTSAPLEGAAAIAERVREKIAATALTLADGRQIALSASFGVASTEGEGQCTLAALVHDADVALYRAKADGRNRVRTSHKIVLSQTSSISL